MLFFCYLIVGLLLVGRRDFGRMVSEMCLVFMLVFCWLAYIFPNGDFVGLVMGILVVFQIGVWALSIFWRTD